MIVSLEPPTLMASRSAVAFKDSFFSIYIDAASRPRARYKANLNAERQLSF